MVHGYPGWIGRNRKKSSMITLGIDVGSLTTKALVLEDSNILSSSLLLTGEDASDTTAGAVSQSLEQAGLSLSQIAHIVSTGVGRSYVPYPTKPAAEVRCNIVGSRFLYPSARGVIDVGAENSRVVKCDLKGNIVDFATNDKCAAGTGVFLDAMAKVLQIEPREMQKVHQTEQGISITSTCVVFAESEVVSLIHKGGVNRFSLWRGISSSIASRVYSLVTKLRMEGEIVVIGGVASNLDFIISLEEMIGGKLLVPPHPQTVGALGAAILAQKATP